jgi:glc operon protein GlcG
MNNLRYLAVFLLFSAAVQPAHSEVTTKKTLTLEGAKKVIAAAVAEARRLNAPGGAIAVVDDGGNLMAVERLDNTFAASGQISIGKARTAAIFKRSTKGLEEIVNKGRTAMVTLDVPVGFTPLMGGEPITVGGQIVGAVGVSGAASAQQDEDIAVAAARAIEGKTASTQSDALPVIYFNRKKVEEAFAKGAPLIGAEEQKMYAAKHYMVHASRRDKPGVAEIHTWDTDVIYVLEGSATLVTGGKAVSPKEIAPGEIRGTMIEGGETRKIGTGDVIIIPNGVPHWFKEVNAPFLYFVVKPRIGE